MHTFVCRRGASEPPHGVCRCLLVSAVPTRRPDGCSDALHEAMTSCWRPSPKARPTFSSLRGTIKLLTMPECDVLLQSVWSVTHWKGRSTHAAGGLGSGANPGSELGLGAFGIIEYKSGGKQSGQLGISTPVRQLPRGP